MTSILKAAGAFVFILLFAGGSFASSEIDRAFDLPEWSESCTLPSVTASSPITRDDDVRLASDSQSIAAPASCANQDSCAGCSSSSECDGCSTSTCCCCPPIYYASVGTVILHRDRPDAGTISAADPSLTPYSTGRDFDFGWDAGLDITVGRRLANGDSLEGRYFNNDAEASHSFTTPGSFIGPGFQGPGATLIAGRYLTTLHSTELNYRHALSNRIDFLTGFRWIELSDDLRYQIGNGLAADIYDYNNHLYGGQIGADWALTNRCTPLQINAVGKVGLYGNVSDGGTSRFEPATTLIDRYIGDDNTTAFVSELDLSAAYWLTCNVAIRGGYQLLWLDNLALAAEAASRSLTNPSLLRDVENDGDLFYHGATAAIDFVW